MARELTREALARFARRERAAFEGLLEELVNVPTVSADPARGPDFARGVALVSKILRDAEADVRVQETDGNPVVHAILQSEGSAPAVTIYNHLDVQPASAETEPWTSDPFRLRRDGNRYFGRGATDDKGPALTALFGVRAARELGVPVNVRFLWEFEEEVSSPHFGQALSRLGRRARTDAVVVSDGLWLARNRPASTSGLRGFQGFRFELVTGTGDTHSGTTGGAARNPLAELMALVCEIYDPKTGRVKIPGFYDDVEAPTRRELSEFRRSGFSLRGFRRDYGLESLRTDDPLDALKRIWTLPTFEVHGAIGGYTGPGMKAIIPARAEVKASCRLVPRQTPARAFRLVRDFVKRKNPAVRVSSLGSASPFRGETTGPLPDALRRAVRFAFGREPAFVRGGGTIGAVLTMRERLRCPIVFLNLSLPEHGYHAPDEHYDWGQASGGMAAFARLLAELPGGALA